MLSDYSRIDRLGVQVRTTKRELERKLHVVTRRLQEVAARLRELEGLAGERRSNADLLARVG